MREGSEELDEEQMESKQNLYKNSTRMKFLRNDINLNR